MDYQHHDTIFGAHSVREAFVQSHTRTASARVGQRQASAVARAVFDRRAVIMFGGGFCREPEVREEWCTEGVEEVSDGWCRPARRIREADEENAIKCASNDLSMVVVLDTHADY